MTISRKHVESHLANMTAFKELSPKMADAERKVLERALSVADMIEILQAVEDKTQPLWINFFDERLVDRGFSFKDAWVIAVDEMRGGCSDTNVTSSSVRLVGVEAGALDVVVSELELDEVG